MLFINMVALLAYNLLQRQMQQQGLQMRVPSGCRRLIARLDALTVIETHCWDGSCLRRLTPTDPELSLILQQVRQALDQMVHTVVAPDQSYLLPPDADPDAPRALLC